MWHWSSSRGYGAYPARRTSRRRISIIGMGKAGARELNYVSDVDVIYVVEAIEGFAPERAVEVATRLAIDTRGAHPDPPAIEPELWEVDANFALRARTGRWFARWIRTWPITNGGRRAGNFRP